MQTTLSSAIPSPEYVQTVVMWNKPKPNFVKVNFDASYIDSTKSGAWGFIARSETGEFVAAAAGKLQYLRSALQAETEACLAAVEGAVALGLHRVIF
jgi:ribonuclease HI